MISRRLFQNSSESESDVLPFALRKLSFNSTPKKSKTSLKTLEVQRKWEPATDEDSVLPLDDYAPDSSLTMKHTSQESNEIQSKQHRSKSVNIKEFVNTSTDDTDLVADGSRQHALPTIAGKHSDLKSITPQTLAHVIKGHYDDKIENYRIIDCRYPYEYDGGHVKDAENMYLHETILTLLQTPTSGKQVLIFHCEFSMERGPKMLKFLRSKDRELNKENYPAVNFPEIYLLEGGYKAFFNKHPELCDPINYRPMLQSEYSSDLKHFRSKSKSWTAGEKKRHARKAIRL